MNEGLIASCVVDFWLLWLHFGGSRGLWKFGFGSIWLDCKEDQGLGKILKKKKCRRKLCRLVSDGREMM